MNFFGLLRGMTLKASVFNGYSSHLHRFTICTFEFINGDVLFEN